MPTAYSYLRVSHRNSAMTGLSAGAQLDVCYRYYLHHLKPKEVLWYGLTEIPPGLNLDRFRGDIPLLYDPAISARHIPFLSRSGGARLGAMLKRGDHVIFSHLDRGFRAVLDHSALIDLWQALGIRVHYADMNVDLQTPHGMLVANIMAAVAQGQSDLISQRNKEIANKLRKLNRPCNGQKKLGYKTATRNGCRQWMPDWPERPIMAEIVRLHDEEGWSFEAISNSVEQRVCECEGREFKDSAFFKREWGPSKCRRAYLAYKRILEEEGAVSKRA